MSDVGLELQLCQTNTVYGSLNTCIDMVRKDYENSCFQWECLNWIIIVILILIAVYTWRKICKR